jgi:hypothetical protein
MHAMKPARSDPDVDRLPPYAEPTKLPDRDDPVLPTGDLRENFVDLDDFWAHMTA